MGNILDAGEGKSVCKMSIGDPQQVYIVHSVQYRPRLKYNETTIQMASPAAGRSAVGIALLIMIVL